jgi:hypothetical protein
MKQKPALFLSITLTAFVIVVLSTVIAKANTFDAQFNGKGQDITSENISNVEQIYLQREQEYLDVINEANQQIVDMQKFIEETQAAGGVVEFAFTATQAAVIASEAAIGAFQLAGTAEIVSYEGIPAFEVPFNDGNEDGNIYIDANFGTVLFNGTVVFGPPRFYETGAALVASDYLNRNDVVSSILDTLNGEEVYMVTFGNRDVVFVSKYGVLLQVRLSATGGNNSGNNHDNNNNDDDDNNNNDDDDNDDD